MEELNLFCLVSTKVVATDGVFGSYEKHIAMLAPLIENKFVYYEDYKAYVDALPTDKNDEFYQRLREKLGFVTEEGYRHSFEW